jgi:hypothetical protein
MIQVIGLLKNRKMDSAANDFYGMDRWIAEYNPPTPDRCRLINNRQALRGLLQSEFRLSRMIQLTN